MAQVSGGSRHNQSIYPHTTLGMMSFLLLMLAACLQGAHAGKVHEAARSNDVAKLTALKTEGKLEKDLNQPEKGSGQTPLMAATLAGAADSVKFLLEQNADATIGEKDGYTPFHGAGFQGRAEVAKHLLAHGLNPSDRHSDGSTPLHRACWGREMRHTEMVRFLVKEGGV